MPLVTDPFERTVTLTRRVQITIELSPQCPNVEAANDHLVILLANVEQFAMRDCLDRDYDTVSIRDEEIIRRTVNMPGPF